MLSSKGHPHNHAGHWVQMCYIILAENLQGRSGDNSLERAVAFQKAVGPPGNFLPPSGYILRKLLGYVVWLHALGCSICVPWLKQASSLNDSACRVQDAAHYEYHSCPCGRHCWPPTPRRQWAQHANDMCPCCQNQGQNQPRFKRHRETKRLAPRQVGFLAPLCGHLICPSSNRSSACRCSMPSLAKTLSRALPPSQSSSRRCANTGTGVQLAILGALMPSALMHSLPGSCWGLRASRSQSSWIGAACTRQLTIPRASCASGADRLGFSAVQACTHRCSAAHCFMCR